MAMRNQPSRALIRGSIWAPPTSAQAASTLHDAVAFGFDAASGMDSLVSITFQCQDLRLVRLTGHGRTLKARNAIQTGNLRCRQ
jgi:hypothetical protein